jgi:AraC family transcriptional regulator, transcriptional activator of pobA
MKQKIYNLDLVYGGAPVSFIIKALEEIVDENGGIVEEAHRHNYYSVIWSFTATGTHIIDFREYPIVPQHIFFVSPRQVHQVMADPDPTGMIILFTPEFLQRNSIREDFISNLKLFRDSDETPPLPIDEQMAGRLRTYAVNMRTAFDGDGDMKFEVIGAWLKLFLIECNGHCTLQPPAGHRDADVGRSLVQRFKQAVEAHFHEWHQVKNYAMALNVSPNYLNEVISSNINTPAKDYIRHRLILEAKRMTLFTPKSSKEIGFDLGFEDPSHFSKFFKSSTGQSLVQFRETHPF